MAQIKKYPLVRQLRSDNASYIQKFRKGQRVKSGRGLSFWFFPDAASLSEIPMDDRELQFIFSTRSGDFQEVTVQGNVLWRVGEPERLGDRIDFSIDLRTGQHQTLPIDQIQNVITSLAQQYATEYLGSRNIRAILDGSVLPLQARLIEAFNGAATLKDMGLTLIDVRIASISPTMELARALQTPTFEKLQQLADEATFERRALAVEKERAIAENELNTQIELATKKSKLIEREDENARKQATARAASMKIDSAAEADKIRIIEQARADMDKQLVSAYNGVDPSVLVGLAAKEFVGKVGNIEHLSITPDMLAKLFTDLGKRQGPSQSEQLGIVERVAPAAALRTGNTKGTRK